MVHHTGYKRITLLFALSDAILSVAAFKSFHLEADVLYKNMAGTRGDEYEVICNQCNSALPPNASSWKRSLITSLIHQVFSLFTTILALGKENRILLFRSVSTEPRCSLGNLRHFIGESRTTPGLAPLLGWGEMRPDKRTNICEAFSRFKALSFRIFLCRDFSQNFATLFRT